MTTSTMRTVLMLSAGLVVALRAGAATEPAVHHRAQTPVPVAAGAQPRDAETILREMRAALGGDAALDAIRSFRVDGTVRQRGGGFATILSIELSVLLPDHFLEARRDINPTGPMPVDITYYAGFRGDTLIRRTDSNIPFPPDPGPQTPAAIAERERRFTLKQKQSFARLAWILFGKSFSSYMVQFTYLGAEQRDGRAVEVLEATAADGYRMLLSVDAGTHLPAMVAYLAPQTLVVSSTSTVLLGSRGTVSQAPLEPAPRVDPSGLPMIDYRLSPSNFKAQDGVNWPRRLTETVGKEIVSETNFGKFRLNPRLEPKRFEISR